MIYTIICSIIYKLIFKWFALFDFCNCSLRQEAHDDSHYRNGELQAQRGYTTCSRSHGFIKDRTGWQPDFLIPGLVLYQSCATRHHPLPIHSVVQSLQFASKYSAAVKWKILSKSLSAWISHNSNLCLSFSMCKHERLELDGFQNQTHG